MERCTNCGLFASEDLGTGYFLINNDVFCGVYCFDEDYKKTKNPKTENRTQTNKSNKRQKQIFKKRAKPKKRSK